MLGKNNKHRELENYKRKEYFSIRKFKMGAASVTVGSALFFLGGTASANEVAVENKEVATSIAVEAPKAVETPKEEKTEKATPVVEKEEVAVPKPKEVVVKAKDTRNATISYKVNYVTEEGKVVKTVEKTVATETTEEVASKFVTENAELPVGYSVVGEKEQVKAVTEGADNVLTFTVKTKTQGLKANNTVPTTTKTERPANEGQDIPTDKVLRDAVSASRVKAGNGVTVDAKIDVADRVYNNTDVRLSYRVDIPDNTYRAGDTLTIRLDELGYSHKLLPELVSNDGIVYAKLNKDPISNYNSSTTGSAAFWAQRDDKYSATEKLAHNIKAEGYSYTYTYVFNENIEGLRGTYFVQNLASTLRVPRVNEDVPIVGKISVNGVPVVTKPMTIAAEPLENIPLTDKFSFSTTGTIYLNKDGEIREIEPTINLSSGRRIEQNSILTIDLNENDLSKFVKTGDHGLMTAQVEGGFNAPAATVNENKVILFGKRTSPKFQVVELAENKLGLKIVEGSMEPGLNYRIRPEAASGLPGGFTRVFTEPTYNIVNEAIKRGDNSVSLTGGSVTLTKPNGQTETAPETQTVNWGIVSPITLTAFSGGIPKPIEGNAIMRYIEETTGKILIAPKAIVNTKENLLVDKFTTSVPTENLTSISTNEDNKTVITQTEDNGVKTYSATAPYLIKDTAGNYYSFTKYTTDNKYYANSKTEGVLTLKQANVVSNYKKLGFGSVTVHYVIDNPAVTDNASKVKLQKSTVTKYNGKANDALTSLEGKPYDVTSVTAPATLTKDGLVYELKPTAPANVTGTLTNGNTDVYYLYAPKAGKSVKVKYEDSNGNQLLKNDPEVVVKEEGTQVGTTYNTTNKKRSEITEGGNVYELRATQPLKENSAPEEGRVSNEEQVVTYVYVKVTQDAVVKFVVKEGTTEKVIPNVNDITTKGRSNTPIPADTVQSVTDKIAELERNGYQLVSNQLATPQNFDNDVNQLQEFKVVLVEKVVDVPTGPQNPNQPVGPNNPIVPYVPGTTTPVQPGQPINPNNPNGPKWDEGKINEVKGKISEEVTRTIRYKYLTENGDPVLENGNPLVKTETLYFKKDFKVNYVTGAVTYADNWTPLKGDEFSRVPSPVITGYLANKKEVSAEPTTATTPDFERVVVYTPIGSYVPYVPTDPNRPVGADNPPVPLQPTNPTDPNDPGNPTPYPNDPTDPTKPGKPTGPIKDVPGTKPYVPTNPKDPNSPLVPLTPVDPADPSRGYNPPTPTTPGQDTPVVYIKENQTAIVKFVEEGTEKEVAEKETLTGKSNSPIDFTSSRAKLDALKKKGYEIVTNPIAEDRNFDSNSKEDQEFKVVVRPKVVPVDPTSPNQPQPGQPVDPTDPNSPLWPEPKDPSKPYSASALKEEVNRTVKYVKIDESNNEVSSGVADHTDKVSFDRTASVNLVTGEVTYTEWIAKDNDTTFDSHETPILNGYFADKSEVPTISGIKATDEDVNEKVVYRKLGKFVPNVPEGFDVPELPVYPNSDNPSKPGVPTTPIPHIPGLIPNGPDGNPLTPVDPADPSKGYNPPAPPTNPGENITITYVKQGQKAVVTFVEESTKEQVAPQVSLDGESKSPIDFTPAKEKLEELKLKGYVVVTNPLETPATYDTDEKTTQNFEVVLKVPVISVPVGPKDPSQPAGPNNPVVPINPDGTPVKPGQPINPNNPNGPKWDEEKINEVTRNISENVTRTIEYKYEDGNSVKNEDGTPKVVKETLNFKRNFKINGVTGEVTYDEWTSEDNEFDRVPTPVITGYLADKKEVPSETANATDEDKTVGVTYRPIGSYVPYAPKDPNQPVGENNPLVPLQPTNPNDPNDPANPTPYPNDPTDPTKPGQPTGPIKDIPGTKPYVPTNPKDPNSPLVPLTPVDPNDPSKGYVPPVPAVPGEDTPIVYVPVKPGSWVPTVPEGYTPIKPIPYPTDPTKPLPPLPYIPGLVPMGPDGNPLKPVDPNDPSKGYVPPVPAVPGEDTPIVYVPVKPEQPTNPNNPGINTPEKPGSWIIEVPGGYTPIKPIPYPTDPTKPLPPLPYIPGLVPMGPDGNPLKPVDPNDPSKGYVPPVPAVPGEDTLIVYVPVNPVQPTNPNNPGTSTPVKPGVPSKSYVTTNTGLNGKSKGKLANTGEETTTTTVAGLGLLGLVGLLTRRKKSNK